MPITRYRNTPIISGSYYGSFFLSADDLASIPVYYIRTNAMDRLDTLAFKYLGAGHYYWIIAILNNIDWAFSFEAGDVLKIPHDVQDVLRYV